MRFLPKETCEKLVKMGCSSESGFSWVFNKKLIEDWSQEKQGWALQLDGWGPKIQTGNLPAFTLEDFVSTDEYAQENRKIIFPDKFCIDCNKIAEQDCKTSHLRQEGDYYFLNEIVNSKDWVEFISKAVEERSKTL